MAFSNSARGQLTAIVPGGSDAPALVAHLQGLVDKIEPMLVLRISSIANAATELGSFTQKMMVITNTDEVWFRNTANSAWLKIFPVNYSGTAVPAGTLGQDGDTYDRYV